MLFTTERCSRIAGTASTRFALAPRSHSTKMLDAKVTFPISENIENQAEILHLGQKTHRQNITRLEIIILGVLEIS